MGNRSADPDVGVLTPEAFGAVGDGAADDADAFARLNAAVAMANGGTVSLRRGAVYRIGRQSRGSSVYLEGRPGLFARDVPRFVVRMNGAIIKFNDGLKFGSFDPKTGQALHPEQPFYDASVAADVGHAIFAINVGYFEVTDGLVDCNSAGLIIGGPWGDTGWQRLHYGVAAHDCGEVVWADVKIVNSCVDGFLYARLVTPASPKYPFAMRRCEVDRAGRNCISITGTNSAVIEDCRFVAGGDAPISRDVGAGDSLSSKPRSCFCIEAEESVCKNIVVRNTQLLGTAPTFNSFTAVRGATSDILAEDCLMRGPVYTVAPRTAFRRCEIRGGFAVVLGGQPDPGDNTIVERCRISDKRWADDQAPGFAIISGQAAGSTPKSPVVVRDTSFDVNFQAPDFRYMRLENVTVNLLAGPDAIEPGSDPMLVAGAYIRNLRLVDRTPSAGLAKPYVVQEADRADVVDAEIISPRRNLRWGGPGATSPYTGRLRPQRPGAD